MKPIVKQKQSTVQDIINKAQAGGGGTDSYTKAEADAKFQAKADMTDYIEEQTGGYIVVNGIRIYVSSTEPTGNIPEGSIGFGW
ncbi:MAG: hypothetical protein J6U97_05550 [Bacteroidaceae bacterium]|nr:hypothetical protein [Bacteroidaceae bacterium]